MDKITMTKKYMEVADRLAKESDLELPKMTQKLFEILREASFQTIVELTDEGHKVATTVGTFEKQHKDATTARNPRTKETVNVDAKDVLKHKHNAISKKLFVK